jgi:cell division control protein 6
MPESDSIDSIFKKAKEGKILFEDRNPLFPEYIPNHLPFRDSQIAAVAQIVSPALHGSKPSNILVYGKTGTGKTAVVRYVLAKLKSEDPSAKIMISYVNTKIEGTEYRTLGETAKLLGTEIPDTGVSIGTAINRIFHEIQQKGANVILVLDEIDHLVKTYGDTILYDFTRAGERIRPGLLTVIGISNDLTFKEQLDPRILSGLGEEEIVFPPYTVDELRQILEERAKITFKPGAISQSAINICAALAGSEHGDARRAVDLLRVAGEVAEREGYQTIDDDCVRRASKKMERDRVEEAVRSLPLQNKAILASIVKFPEGTNTGALYATYGSFASKLNLEILTQRRVSGILAELDMMGLIQAAVVSKGRRGRTKKIRLLINPETVTKTLSEDSIFSGAA